MNAKQKIILWLGIAVIVAMGLCPPWVRPVHSPSFGAVRQDLGYSPIWQPAIQKRVLREETYSLHGSIDFQRLGVQWAVVAVITGGLVAIFAGKKKDSAIQSV